MFRGGFEHTVDAKGRVSIPSKFRDIIMDRYDGKLMLSKELDRCLRVYPLEEWEKFEAKVMSLPSMQKEVKEFQRFLFSSTIDCELDNQGRILLPASHREYAGIDKQVKVIGMIDKIEIWDAAAWEAHNTQNSDKISEALARLDL